MHKILLGSVVAIALLSGCSEEKKSSSQTSTETVKEVKQEVTTSETTKDATSAVVVESANEVKETVIQSAPEVAEKTNEIVKESVEAANELAKDVTKPIIEETVQKIEEVKESADIVKEDITTNVKEVVDVVVNNTNEVKEEITTTETAIDAKVLFTSCASCHGQKAEKSALGKSQVIAGWDKSRIINALNGYKDGTYGGVMKNIMKGQVSTKTDEEIDALAGFISNL